jgi:hypothetical protein
MSDTHQSIPLDFTERPYLLFPVGYPAEDAEAPDIERKPLGEIAQWNRGDANGSDS